MATIVSKNAIERRVDRLAENWTEFTENSEARILCWLIDDDSARIVDLFLELQNEDVSDIPDLFVRFNEPFEVAQPYGLVLRDSLLSQYADVKDGIAQEGIDDNWMPPSLRDGDSDAVTFVRTCISLQEHYGELLAHVAPVLTPSVVADNGAWVKWLDELLASDIPPGVRFLVFDSPAKPVLDDLPPRHAERIVTVQPDLDMLGAYAELVRDIPGSGPGFDFRRLFIALSCAAATGNLMAAQRSADRALAVAIAQNWPQMQTVVHMTLGAAMFAAGDISAARKCYHSANQAIADSGGPAAAKLDVQTRFAEASACVGEQKYEEAAQLYEQIAPLAEEQQDHFALLECRRMEAYCHQSAGKYEAAWRAGQQALEAGALLEDDIRKNSTLPYVAQGLLQLIEAGHVAPDDEGVRSRMVQLVSDDWEAKLEAGAAPS